MMLFDSEYAIYAEYLKSAIKLFKAGKNIFGSEPYEVTLDMLHRGLDGWYTEAKKLLECEFTMAFGEKYFTQEFPHADHDGTVASLIDRREKYYLGQ